jgi:4-hydroxy-tetrahydrodipicolinate reductase
VSAPNFSQGVAVLRRALADVARHLPDWDVEIVEMHHRRKRDAPSGTALALGRTVAEARAQRFEEVLRYGRHGSDEARADGEIAIHALRGGDIVGEHTVRLSGPGEHVSLVHVATSREAFARGAIRAARWVHDKRPGAYTFEDVTA